MDCDYIETHDLTQRFLNERLPAQEKRAFQAHVADCDRCRTSLQLAASLMLEPAVVAPPQRQAAPESFAERITRGWREAVDWLSSPALGIWRPALAFAALLVIALPALVWMPTDPDVPRATTYRAGQSPAEDAAALGPHLAEAVSALERGEPQAAMVLLQDTSRWNKAPLDTVFEAYRVRGRAAHALGKKEEAEQSLERALRLTFAPDRMECVRQDIKAVQGEGEFCPLPEVGTPR